MHVFAYLKEIIAVFFFVLSISAHSQLNFSEDPALRFTETGARLWIPHHVFFTLENPNSVFEKIVKNHSNKFGQKLINTIKSNHGKHYLFIQTYLNKEIFGTELIISTDLNNKVIAATCNFQESHNFSEYPDKITENIFWFYDKGKLLPVNYHKTIQNNKHYEVLTDTKGKVIYQVDAKRYYSTPPDSFVSGFVFYPDPLTSSNSTYGGKYANFNDSATQELTAELKNVNFRTSYKNDTFKIGDEFLKFTEISLPITPQAISSTPYFNFNRHQPQFEEVNVLYHLSSFRKHIQNLGFSQWIDTLLVDCHAFDGAEQSAYDPLVLPHTLEFGDGGVDDAEDADVAIHEFVHSISFKALPGKNIGAERKAIEEGICDYFAMSYSRSLSNNQSYMVYNWDGHNTFWPGRSTNISGNYPTALTGDIYISGQIFSTALAYLYDLIGRDSCDKLVLSLFPYLSSGINMQQASAILLKIDSLVFYTPHTKQIYHAFTRKNLLQWPANIKSVVEKQKPTAILVNDETNLLPEHKYCKVYTFDGQFLFESNGNQTLVNTLQLSSGIYIGVFVEENNKSSVYKILRF